MGILGACKPYCHDQSLSLGESDDSYLDENLHAGRMTTDHLEAGTRGLIARSGGDWVTMTSIRCLNLFP